MFEVQLSGQSSISGLSEEMSEPGHTSSHLVN